MLLDQWNPAPWKFLHSHIILAHKPVKCGIAHTHWAGKTDPEASSLTSVVPVLDPLISLVSSSSWGVSSSSSFPKDKEGRSCLQSSWDFISQKIKLGDGGGGLTSHTEPDAHTAFSQATVHSFSVFFHFLWKSFPLLLKSSAAPYIPFTSPNKEGI